MDAPVPWRIHVPPVTIAERVHHDGHMLLWQARGRSSFTVDGQPWELATGQALWLPAGASHAFTVHANSVLLPLHFEADQLATTLRCPTVIAVDRELRTLLLAELQAQNSIIEPAVNIARQILALIEDRPAVASVLTLPTAPSARAIAETLRFNPGDDRSVAELAASVHTSARTVERAFRAETGMTLRQWRFLNRMEAAAELLRTATHLGSVAHRVGYSDPSAFGRVFKAHTGVSPSEYARRHRAEP